MVDLLFLTHTVCDLLLSDKSISVTIFFLVLVNNHRSTTEQPQIGQSLAHYWSTTNKSQACWP